MKVFGVELVPVANAPGTLFSKFDILSKTRSALADADDRIPIATAAMESKVGDTELLIDFILLLI